MNDVIRLSEAFSALIRISIKKIDLDAVNELNQDPLRFQCATIEYCLSPLLMQDAFRECFGRFIPEFEAQQTEEDAQLWTLAWTYSRINGFKSLRERCLITLN